jgi:hypothetical protein
LTPHVLDEIHVIFTIDTASTWSNSCNIHNWHLKLLHVVSNVNITWISSSTCGVNCEYYMNLIKYLWCQLWILYEFDQVLVVSIVNITWIWSSTCGVNCEYYMNLIKYLWCQLWILHEFHQVHVVSIVNIIWISLSTCGVNCEYYMNLTWWNSCNIHNWHHMY